jgi:hypothetical protein
VNCAQRITLWLVLAILLPVYLLLVLILLPAIGLPYVYRSLTIRWRLRRAWRAGQWILLSYTQSAVWAPYLENEVIPRLGDACVAIDRSRPDWKARHPAEARAIAHWGGYYEHNPLVVLFPRWRPARRIRLYHAFRDSKHGKPGALQVQLDRLYGLVGR